MRYKLIGLAVFIVFVVQLPSLLRAAEIPLRTSGGIYTAPVQINRSITLEFLVDPGAGVVVIPTSVLRQLMQNGTVTESDALGVGTAETADNSLHLTATVRLRELRIGNTVVRDVTAAVSPALRQPLLGQSFLGRFAYVTFDNRRQMLILPDEAPAPAAQSPAATWVAPYPSYPTPGAYSGGAYSPPTYYPGYGR
jgi:clan AA aspartic protease (TIGR02281 family)